MNTMEAIHFKLDHIDMHTFTCGLDSRYKIPILINKCNDNCVKQDTCDDTVEVQGDQLIVYVRESVTQLGHCDKCMSESHTHTQVIMSDMCQRVMPQIIMSNVCQNITQPGHRD